MRYLAIDYGTRRSGLAICDVKETIASPLCVLRGQESLLGQIAQIVKAEGVQAVVVGLPLNMDGSEGPQARLVRGFAERLGSSVGLPIYFEDERLSSFSAAEKLDQAGLSKARQRELIDAVAAAEILQSFLDRTRTAKDQ
jgi:putative Holliday junction resolvase